MIDAPVPEDRVAATSPSPDSDLVPVGAGIVAATEQLYQTMFAVMIGLSTLLTVWGTFIIPFDSYNRHKLASLGLGAAVVAINGVVFRYRQPLFYWLRRDQRRVALVTLAWLGVLVIDGPWRSTYLLATFTPLLMAGVVCNRRDALLHTTLLSAGYFALLAAVGRGPAELAHAGELPSVLGNIVTYYVVGFFAQAFVAWLASYVARINQVITEPIVADSSIELSRGVDAPRTADLSVREVQVVQLLADGKANKEIAAMMFLSERTVQSHVASAMKKTAAANRTELAVLAVSEGLVPMEPSVGYSEPPS